MKLYALPIAAALMGAVLMTSTAQAAPAMGGALKAQAGQTMVEQAGMRCRRVCHGWGRHRHCKLVCRGHRHH